MRALWSDHSVDAGRVPTRGIRLEDSDPRVALLAPVITRRLRPVCAEWDEARFQALVLKIARMRVRWSEMDGTSPQDFE